MGYLLSALESIWSKCIIVICTIGSVSVFSILHSKIPCRREVAVEIERSDKRTVRSPQLSFSVISLNNEPLIGRWLQKFSHSLTSDSSYQFLCYPQVIGFFFLHPIVRFIAWPPSSPELLKMSEFLKIVLGVLHDCCLTPKSCGQAIAWILDCYFALFSDS